MRYITVLSTKGGVGKSTIASCLFEWFCDHGYTVSYFDMDPQGGSPVSPVHDPDADLSIVDTPGALDEKLTPQWVAAADLVLVPTLASPYDLPALERTLDVVRRHRRVNSRLAVVVNRYDARLSVTRAYEDALRRVTRAEVLTLPESTNLALAALEGKHAWRYRRQSPSAAALDRLGRFCEAALGWEPREEKRPSSGRSEAETGGEAL